MKKYFITDTKEEVVLGETIQLDLVKKTKHGVHRVEGEVTLDEFSVPLLIEMGAIEVHEEDEEDVLDFDECDVQVLADELDELKQNVEHLRKCMLNNQKETMELLKTIAGKAVKKEPEKKK